MTTETRPVRVGADIGGTFTDLQIFDARTRRLMSHKVPTTPADPSIGLVEGLKAAAEKFGFALADIAYLLHGTTIATNAVLERKFPSAALVTTAGFEDVLEIGRHSRRDIYSIRPHPAPPLIRRDRRLGVAERMTATGRPELEPTGEALDALVAQLAEMDVQTIAIALLNAYVNPAHEERVAERLARAFPALAVTASSRVSPEIREYERTNTTVLNALLIPVVRSYLEKLEQRIRDEGLAARLLIVQSNGGVCSPATAAREPVRLLLSGPSGGALGALATSRALGESALVGVDMGGTSFDVSVISNGRIELVTQSEIDRLPVRVPMIEIRTIGAGGGSIARVKAGRVSVGPESAGAVPGPVCYGRGGAEPTVTDANLLLGRLDAAYFLGGGMRLDLDGSRAAMNARVATPLGLDAERAAEGVIAITNTNLAAAIRLSLFEKGLDPRDFAMLSFGGAGSIHACAVAEELGITRVIFPTDASTFSAWGILHSDIGHDLARSRVMPLDANAATTIAALADEMRAQANAQLAADGIAQADRALRLAADLRYKGQAFELTVPWPGDGIDAGTVAEARARFDAAHLERFSYSNPHDIVELVTLRLSATGQLAPIDAAPPRPPLAPETPKRRRVWIDSGWRDVAVYRRDAIAPDQTIEGPAIIEEEYTTLFIGARWTVSRLPNAHIRATRRRATP